MYFVQGSVNMVRGRPATGKQKQLTVSVNEEQRAALEAASAKAGHSVAEEIRRRLDRTLYEEDTFDPQTRKLAEDIRDFAHEIERITQLKWHAYPKAHEALAEAIKTWLAGMKPPFAPSEAASDLLWGQDDPQTVGRMLARTHRRTKEMRVRARQEILNQQKDKGDKS
jgi:hypothetical protein